MESRYLGPIINDDKDCTDKKNLNYGKHRGCLVRAVVTLCHVRLSVLRKHTRSSSMSSTFSNRRPPLPSSGQEQRKQQVGMGFLRRSKDCWVLGRSIFKHNRPTQWLTKGPPDYSHWITDGSPSQYLTIWVHIHPTPLGNYRPIQPVLSNIHSTLRCHENFEKQSKHISSELLSSLLCDKLGIPEELRLVLWFSLTFSKT